MDREDRIKLIRILITGVMFLPLVVAEFTSFEIPYEFYISLVPYLLIGYDILWRACVNIVHGEIFDENFLMVLATIGAFCIGEYSEAVAVMLFYQVGEFCQDRAVAKSRRSIASLMDIRPDYANLEKDGVITAVSPDEVQKGDVIVIKPGEKIPLDGVVVEGESTLDTAALTGESVPRRAKQGDDVISGCINMSGLIKVKVSGVYGESTVAKILDLVENSSKRKAKSENFITRFARWYTPVVVIGALLYAVIPPIFFTVEWTESIKTAVEFLVVSCPCALVISVPLAFFGGIGGASRKGILVKGASTIEALSKIKVAAFDKTGTLTKGKFVVTAIHPETIPEQKLLLLAATAEHYSDHPISLSLKAACRNEIDKASVLSVEELSGMGVKANINGDTVWVGNEELMAKAGVAPRKCSHIGTIVHVAAQGLYAGHIVISDEIKEDSASTVSALKKMGVKTVILTGDSSETGQAVGKQLGVDDVESGLLPADKVGFVEKLKKSLLPKTTLMFAGDGTNDAPVLALADVGVAMGALGSAAAVEAADVVIMDDKPSKIITAMRFAKKSLRIVRENIIFTLSVKAAVLISAMLFPAFLDSDSSIYIAVFADVGVSVIAVLNAIRALRIRK